MEIELEDDWFGSDFSCCFCVPLTAGIKLILAFQMLNFLGLFFQINNVTDDGSSKGEVAGPKFYYMSYACLSPHIFTFFYTFKFLLKDNADNRENIVSGAFWAMSSICMLYTWFFVYFLSIEDNMNLFARILLVILLFATP